MSDTSHTAFFGDAEYTFRLTAPMIIELERNVKSGLGALCERVFNRNFSLTDLTETIRLALIGGGIAPERAAQLIATYATDRPLAEIQPLADAILSARWFGKPKEEEK